MPMKLRKLLGDVNAPSTVALRELIDTRSKDTIRKWCLDYAEKKILPIFEKYCPDDNRPRNAVNAAHDYLDGKVKFTIVKNIILNECHAAARELDANPTAQAAAIAYDRIGLDATDEEYAQIAEEVCLDYTDALRTVAVDNEPNPAKLKWNC